MSKFSSRTSVPSVVIDHGRTRISSSSSLPSCVEDTAEWYHLKGKYHDDLPHHYKDISYKEQQELQNETVDGWEAFTGADPGI